MTTDIPGTFVITDGAGHEVLTLMHDGEHLALRAFPPAPGEPVLLDLAEAGALADMLAHPWPVIRVSGPGDDGSRP
jgi:hypothetical protein